MMDVYWVCLIVGLALSVLTVAFGAFEGGAHLHGFSVHGHGGIGGHGGLPHPHAHLPHAHAGTGGVSEGPPFAAANFTVIMIFLAWFGGAGALASRAVGPFVALPVAVLAGVLGARIVLLFANRVLAAHDHSMKPGDYSLPGMPATVTLAIREEGCGEIVYVQGGTRKSAAARSEDGSPIANGAEVMVVCFLEGIAYVRPWDQRVGQQSL